jgi:hypothetical protein
MTRLLPLLVLLSGCAAGQIDVPPPEADDPLGSVDLDHDGLPDGWEQQLMTTYAPEVHLAQGEWALPANVDWYLTKVWMRFNHAHCPDHQVIALGQGTQQNLSQQQHATTDFFCFHTSTVYSSGDAHAEFFLQPPDDSVHDGLPNNDDWRVYAHVKPSSVLAGGADIQYWFFYGYDYTTLNFNHEADWEHITVTVDGHGKLSSIYYAEHNYGTQYALSDVTFVRGTHPVVYSAVGTHASYAKPGSYEITGSPYTDHASDGRVWDTGNNVINVGERNAPLSGQDFIRYGGGWGEIGDFSFTTGPRTPSVQGSWNKL